ncbi:MAG TPA: carboxypeptidase regulatory-like domain-containing protein [Anaerolineae bacterium]|nr:carboxypeptidase regulatory-like domain-containing protein [Anaerolineae bacterium]
MKSSKLFNLLGSLFLVVAMLTPAVGVPVAAAAPGGMDKVEALVLDQLAQNGQADFFVTLTESADLSAADQLPTKLHKGQFVYDTLRSTADRTQADLRDYLDAQGAQYRAYYIVNSIFVRGGNEALLQALAARADVASITANHRFLAADPMIDADPPAGTTGVESNISFVRADQAWALANGTGTVLAGNDTGLDWDHPALINQYRGWNGSVADHNYNWWDATGTYPAEPNDGHGHGTHTSGTMVGDDGVGNQIGMAPGARLLHCKNMDNGGYGQDDWFITCFEWDLAPWDLSGANPNPALAPDAINNSWGYGGGGQNQFRGAVDALLAAGIVVEVSAGNEGSGCGSLRSPGDYQEVFTTGSVNHANAWPGTMTGFSSRGPSSLDGNYFPDFTAPGENIRSSVPGGGYQGGWSGTSMSGPHVTALIGLIWSANPSLKGQVDTTYDIIRQTVGPVTSYVGYCGGDYVTGPNNDWGYGTIDALAAVQMAVSYGGAGTLEGQVFDAVTTLPVAGVTITAVRQEGGTWTDTTDASGFYQMAVAAGTFDVTASHVHYEPVTANNVVVAEDGTTVLDFSLTPRGWAYGYVTDYDNGTGIEGAVVSDDYGNSATTNAAGYYELWLDPGTWNLTAVAEDYAPEAATVVIVSGQGTQQDFSLQAAVVFVPSPIEVSVPLGSTLTEPATITNRQPWDYAFEFSERDGGYLPLGGGKATVDVQAGPTAVAENTAVGSGPYQARPAGTITVERGGGINQTNVLLLNADYDSDGYSPIHDLLVAYGDLDSVDLFDARYATPTLDQLLAYNVVLVWSNFVFSDPTGIGNVLADYVDAGGKVIDLMFALDPNWGYQGRFRTEGYTAMTLSGTSYTTSCLGSFDPGHPIMDGVTNVCDLYRGYGTVLTAGSTEVARWQDNELFVAVKDDQSVASINAYVGQAYQWTGQMADVVHNAILWIAVPADVPWLSEDPLSGVVPAVGSLDVDILFDASPAAGVTQPGTYMATLTVKGDPKVNVPVVMTVEAPASFGRLEGTVLGLGYCDGSPVPLEEAEVVVTGASGASVTLLTDAAGYYATWLDEADSPYTVAVTYPGYLPGLATGVVIVGGGTTVQDFDLRLDAPCLTVEPTALEATLNLGETETQQITLTNNGAGAANFEMSEVDHGYLPARKNFLPAATRPSNPDKTPTSIDRAPNAPQLDASGTAKALQTLVGEEAFAVDVYPGYNLVNFTNDNPGSWTIIAGLPGNQYFAGDVINGDFSTLYVIDYGTNSLYTVDTATGAVTLIGPSTPYGGESWTGMTGSVDGTMYASSTNISRSTLYTVDLGTGAVTVVGEITNAPAIIDIAITPEGEMYGVDIVNDNLVQIDPATGAGTVIGYIGFSANYAQGMDYEEESGTLYLAAYSSQGELRIADPATGNTVLVGAFPGGAETDSLAFATGGGGDVPWLSEDPVTGSVPPDGGQVVVDVTFDAGMVSQPGNYFADLKVKSNDPVNKSINVDATLHVNGPTNWGELQGTVMSLGACDANPYPLGGATVCVEGGICIDTEADGTYHLWLEEGTYNLTVTADGHLPGAATVVIQPQQTTVQDFGLRSIEPCISVDPTALEVTLGPDSTLTEDLDIINSGAGDSTFKVVEREVAGKQANTIALVSSTDVSQSVERALQELGYAYDYFSGPPWTSIDFSPYDIVLVGMDGGLAEVADVQKLRTDVLDAGKRLIFLGGTCYQPFAQGMNDYIVLNNTGDYCWTITAPPSWTITDPSHPLADGLPSPYNYVNYSAGYYQIRVTDPEIEQVAVNGDGWSALFRKAFDGDFIWYIDSVYSSYWTDPSDFAFLKQLIGNAMELTTADIPWLSEDPVEGTVPADSTAAVAVTFDSTGLALGDYFANLLVKTQDPANPTITVPVTMHVVEAGASMHLADIAGYFSTDPYGRYLLRVKVGVHNADHDPLGYVAVDASIWSPVGGPYTRTRFTKPSTGYASFPWGSSQAGVWQICVDDLTKAGYVYLPGDNDVPECVQWDNLP